MALFQPPYPPQELKTFGNFEVKQDDSTRLGIFNPSGTEIWDINASGDVTVGGTLLATGLATFDAGITGTGNTGGLTAGSGILGTANIWSALQTFGNDISFGGATLSVASLATDDILQYNGSNWVNVLPTSLGLVNSVSNSDGTLTVSPTTGAVVASLDLGHANTWTALQTFGNNISIGGATLDVVTLTTGNFLYYNGTDWINQALAAGTGISVSDYTITNAGVTSAVAGDGVSVSAATGAVTFAAVLNGTTLSLSSSGLSLNLGNANTWTATQTFPAASLTNSELAGPLVTGLTTASGAGITLTASGSGVAAYTYTPSITGNLVIGAFGITFTAIADSSTSGKLFLSSTTANVLKYYDTQATPILHELAVLDIAQTFSATQTFPAASLTNTELAGPVVTSLTTETAAGITLTASGSGVGAYAYTPSVTLGGDLSGSSLGAATLAKIQGVTLTITTLATNDLLQYNGTDWVNVLPTALGLVNSVSNSDGTLTISPTTGAVVASLDLGHANTWTALQSFSDGISVSGLQQISFSGEANPMYVGAFGQTNATNFGFSTAGIILLEVDTSSYFVKSKNNTLDDGSGNMTVAGNFDAAHQFDTTLNAASSTASDWTGTIAMGGGNSLSVNTGKNTLIIAALATSGQAPSTVGTIYWQNSYGNMYMALVATGSTLTFANNARYFWLAL